MVMSAQLTHLKRLYDKIYSKEYHFVEQGLYKLETEEAKIGFNPTVMETANTLMVESLSLAVYLSSLADLFFLSFFFF